MSTDAFFTFDDAPRLMVLDRSTLEAWALCPWQAKAIEEHRVTAWPLLPVIGEEIHQAISRATHTWVDSGGILSPSELRDTVEAELLAARPDVQPEALEGFRASIYAWASHLHKIHPENILGMDGGESRGKSGQLSVDFNDLGVRVTSELDLLYAGESVELLHEVDWKTGHKIHTAGDVRHSFQFTLHAVLVLEVFPNVQALEVVVWNTRTNRPTYRVEFRRERLGEYRARVRMAIQARATEYDTPTPWPALEKCEQCPAAALCPVAHEPLRDVRRDPAGAVLQLVALEAKADAIKKLLAGHVDGAGQDIVAEGVAFGRRKPSSRKPNATLYAPGQGEAEE
jgi:hypothetical protein